MTAKPGDAELRFRVIEAFAAACNGRRQVDVARIIGSSTDHAHRARDDVRKYGGLELLDLAVADRDLRRSVVRYLVGDDAPDGSPVAAVRDCASMVADCGGLVACIGQALEDHDVDGREAAEIADKLEAICDSAGRWIADLRARGGHA